MLFRRHGKRSVSLRCAIVKRIKAWTDSCGSVRPIVKIKSWVMSCMSWFEDHAERMVGILAALVLLGGAAGLLVELGASHRDRNGLAAIVAIMLDTIHGAWAVLSWLKRRRSRRMLLGAGVEAPVLTFRTSAPALPEAGRDDEDRPDDGKPAQALERPCQKR